MIIRNSTRIRRLVRENLGTIALLVVIGLSVDVVAKYIDLTRKVFSFASLGFFVTALSIFLAFRISEAYQRWWEARKLWGGIVNQSRTLGRRITNLVNADGAANANDGDAVRGIRREMVYRQIAYINALRLSLRAQENWDELSPFLSDSELSEVRAKANKPTAIMQLQGEHLYRLRQEGLLDHFSHLLLDETVHGLVDLQGGCERIKFTDFPDRVGFLTKWSAWIAAVLIALAVTDFTEPMFAFKEEFFEAFIEMFIEAFLVLLMMSLFLLVEKLGEELKNPFENAPNDTPMTAICRTIEIDLRQQLGETDVPPKLLPVGGVLM